MVSPSSSREGRPAARRADGAAGKGRGRKRRPARNGSDRGCEITPRESELTSPGCRRTGTDSQPARGAKQICRGRQRPWCGPRRSSVAGSVVVPSRLTPRPMGRPRLVRGVVGRWNRARRTTQRRCSMLEPDALKGARPVLRGGGGGDPTSLPDRFAGAADIPPPRRWNKVGQSRSAASRACYVAPAPIRNSPDTPAAWRRT